MFKSAYIRVIVCRFHGDHCNPRGLSLPHPLGQCSCYMKISSQDIDVVLLFIIWLTTGQYTQVEKLKYY